MSSISLFPTNAYSTLNTAAARPANQPTTALAYPAYTSQPAVSVSPQMLVQVLALLLPLLMQALSGAQQNTAPVAPPVAQPTTPANPWAALSPASTAPANPWATLSPASTAPANPWAALSPASTAPATQAQAADYISEDRQKLLGLMESYAPKDESLPILGQARISRAEQAKQNLARGNDIYRDWYASLTPKEKAQPRDYISAAREILIKTGSGEEGDAVLAWAAAADQSATGSDKPSPRLKALMLDKGIAQLTNTIAAWKISQSGYGPGQTFDAVEARITAIQKIQAQLQKERAALAV